MDLVGKLLNDTMLEAFAWMKKTYTRHICTHKEICAGKVFQQFNITDSQEHFVIMIVFTYDADLKKWNWVPFKAFTPFP